MKKFPIYDRLRSVYDLITTDLSDFDTLGVENWRLLFFETQ